jgi:hypothetical protein
MNTFVRMSLVMCALALLIMPSVAQITITQAEVSAILASGNIMTNRNDSVVTSVNIGDPGASSWNFSNLVSSNQLVLTSVAPGSTPFSSEFPTATNAFRTSVAYPGIPVTPTVYQYLQLGQTQLLNLGARAREEVFPLVFGTLTNTVTPSEIVYALPIGIGTSWNTAFNNRTLIVVGGITFSDVTTSHNARYTVDAWGPLTLPGGTVQQALRIRKVNLYNGTLILGYIWLTSSGASVQVEAFQQPADTTIVSGTLNVARGKTIWNAPIIQLDVKLSDNVPTEFSLKQNYPNPFNPSTRIEYQMAKEEMVSLKVFNLLGQEVATLVNESKMPGTYAVDWNGDGLPSGMYFYKMQSGSFSSTRRMLLLR